MLHIWGALKPINEARSLVIRTIGWCSVGIDVAGVANLWLLSGCEPTVAHYVPNVAGVP